MSTFTIYEYSDNLLESYFWQPLQNASAYLASSFALYILGSPAALSLAGLGLGTFVATLAINLSKKYNISVLTKVILTCHSFAKTHRIKLNIVITITVLASIWFSCMALTLFSVGLGFVNGVFAVLQLNKHSIS